MLCISYGDVAWPQKKNGLVCVCVCVMWDQQGNKVDEPMTSACMLRSPNVVYQRDGGLNNRCGSISMGMIGVMSFV